MYLSGNYGSTLTFDATTLNIAGSCFVAKAGITTGISTLTAQQITMYPNPTSDYLHVDIPEPLQTTSLKLYNQYGSIAWQQTHIEHKNELNTAQLPAGMYYLVLSENNQQVAAQTIISTLSL